MAQKLAISFSGFRRIASRDSVVSGGNDATKGTTRHGTERSLALAAGCDHRHGPRAGEAGADDRLVIPRAAVWRGVRGQARPATTADATDGGAFHPQAHLRPLRRGAVRALGGEPLLPVLLR